MKKHFCWFLLPLFCLLCVSCTAPVAESVNEPIAAPVADVSFANGTSGSAIVLPPGLHAGSRILVSAHELEENGKVPDSGTLEINGEVAQYTVQSAGGVDEGAYVELSVTSALPVFPPELYDFDRSIQTGEEIVVAGFPARPISPCGELAQRYGIERGQAVGRPRNYLLADSRVQLTTLSADRPLGLSGGAALVWDKKLRRYVVFGGYYGHCAVLRTHDGRQFLGHAIYRPTGLMD